MGVIRVVLVALRPEHQTEQQRVAIIHAAREVFPTIPGVVDFEAGASEEEWDIVLLVHFEQASDVEAYRVHPLHTAFVATHLKPFMARLEARNFET